MSCTRPAIRKSCSGRARRSRTSVPTSCGFCPATRCSRKRRIPWTGRTGRGRTPPARGSSARGSTAGARTSPSTHAGEPLQHARVAKNEPEPDQPTEADREGDLEQPAPSPHVGGHRTAEEGGQQDRSDHDGLRYGVDRRAGEQDAPMRPPVGGDPEPLAGLDDRGHPQDLRRAIEDQEQDRQYLRSPAAEHAARSGLRCHASPPSEGSLPGAGDSGSASPGL